MSLWCFFYKKMLGFLGTTVWRVRMCIYVCSCTVWPSLIQSLVPSGRSSCNWCQPVFLCVPSFYLWSSEFVRCVYTKGVFLCLSMTATLKGPVPSSPFAALPIAYYTPHQVWTLCCNLVYEILGIWFCIFPLLQRKESARMHEHVLASR